MHDMKGTRPAPPRISPCSERILLFETHDFAQVSLAEVVQNNKGACVRIDIFVNFAQYDNQTSGYIVIETNPRLLLLILLFWPHESYSTITA
jgi:hypothetical protein